MRPVPYQMTGAEVEGENPTTCCGWAEEGAWAVHGGSLGPRGLRHLAIVGKAGRAECEKTTSSGFDRAESRGRNSAGVRGLAPCGAQLTGYQPAGRASLPCQVSEDRHQMTRVLLTQRPRPLLPATGRSGGERPVGPYLVSICSASSPSAITEGEKNISLRAFCRDIFFIIIWNGF